MTNANGTSAADHEGHVGGKFDAIEQASEYLAGKVRDLAHGADDYVHDNPWMAVGMVALISLTAGFFLSRRT